MAKGRHLIRNIGQYYLWGLVRLAVAAPWLTLLVTVALAGASLWYGKTYLEFQTSRNALVSSRARYIQIEKAMNADFANLDAIIVVVEPSRLERGKQFVDALATRLREDTQHFATVVEKIDTTSLEGKKLLLLSPADLRTLRQRLEDAQDFITDITTTPGLQRLLVSINQEISKALVSHLTTSFLESSEPSSAPTAGEEQALDVSFLAALFGEMEQALTTPESYLFHSPWGSFFLKDSKLLSQDGYLTSENDRFLFVLVEDRPAKKSFAKHEPAVKALRAYIQELRRDFPDVQAGVTGEQALGNDEMVSAQRDMALATIISIITVSLLYIISFWEVWGPLRVMAALQLAICWTVGFNTLTVGHLNILSVTFAPILIGLADNLGIHLAVRYREERTYGRDFYTALEIAARRIGPGIVTAALSMALAFYVVILADFPGLAELGFIAGSGEMLCLLASFTVLPALMAVSQRSPRQRSANQTMRLRDPLRWLRRFPRTTLGLLGGLTLASLFLLPMPRFDYNLLHLQAQDTESVLWEYRLLEGSGRSSWYAASAANSLSELHRKKAQFAALPAVERVESLASILPTDQQERLTLVQELAPIVDGISGWGEATPIEVEELSTVLSKIRFKLQRPSTEWDPKKRPAEASLEAARQALLTVQERLAVLPQEVAQEALEALQRPLLADFADKLALLQHNIHPAAPITAMDIPSYLRERFIGQSGRYLLRVYARDNIWEREAMRTFVAQLQTVDADVSGPPVVAFYSIPQMRQGFVRGGLYALVTIVGLTFFYFRSLQPTLLALLPLVVGALWMIPLMALFHVPLNIANLIVIPLFIGMSVDSGIHLVNRALETPETATAPFTRSIGKAVLLSNLTTIGGFGSLMVSQHAGIFSFGLLLTLAVGSNILAALIVLPLVFHFFPPGSAPTARVRTTPPVTKPVTKPGVVSAS
jgi:hopanoid biosynthesis associated RND transporter like protein HpnN